MILLYPLRPVPLLLTLITSFMIWLSVFTIKQSHENLIYLIFLLLFLNIVPLTILVLAYFKYLFTALERTASGYPDPPVLSYEYMKPFGEVRPYQLALTIVCVYSLSVWMQKLGWDFPAIFLVLFFVGTLPAFIGLLGMRNGLIASLNPVTLLRFMTRIGATYLALWGVLAIGFGLIVQLYRSGPGLYVAIVVSLYSLVLVFHWLGQIIYSKRNELDYSPDQSPEREAERVAEELLVQRKHRLARIFKERRREQVLAILLSHIEEEEDRLAAHAWYHSELKQWDSQRLALKHAPYYIKALRDAGKHIIADLIQQECRLIDPEFTVE